MEVPRFDDPHLSAVLVRNRTPQMRHGCLSDMPRNKISSPTSYNIVSAMATFGLFPKLPAELRIHIWELTVEPRTVEIRLRDKATCSAADSHPHNSPYLYSSTPVPAPLQTCREARGLGLFQRAFSDLVIYNYISPASDRPYIWFNTDIDTISIGKDQFAMLGGVERLIKRLRFECDHTVKPWSLHTLYKLQHTVEIHVVLCKIGLTRDCQRAL